MDKIRLDDMPDMEIVGGESLKADKPKRGRPKKADPEKQGVSGKTGGESKKKGVGHGRSRERFERSHDPAKILKPPVPMDGGVLQPNLIEAPEGKNTKYLLYSMEVGQLPWLDNWNDPKEINRNATKYFEICAKHDCKPGVAGLALALKMDRIKLWNIVNDQPKAPKIPEECKQLIKYYHQYLNAIWEQMMQGGVNPAAGIFLGINNFGYHNEQNIIVHPAETKSEADIEAIEAKYNEIPE